MSRGKTRKEMLADLADAEAKQDGALPTPDDALDETLAGDKPAGLAGEDVDEEAPPAPTPPAELSALVGRRHLTENRAFFRCRMPRVPLPLFHKKPLPRSTPMKPSLVKDALLTLLVAGEPGFLRGQPGIGKTSLVNQATAALPEFARNIPAADRDPFLAACAKADKVKCLVTRLALADPVDMRGLCDLDREAGLTRWLPPADFPKPSDGPVVWFFDEWAQGMPAVQNAAGQILNERRIGDYVLPDTVRIVAAGNRAKDRAATNKLPTHIADRFTFLDVDFDLNDWTKYMLEAGAPVEVVAFGRFRDELICQFDPQADVSATPRGWEKVGNILKAKPSALTELALYEGKVGKAAALEFKGFLDVFRTLPNVDAILMNPDKEPVPADKPATMYATAGALARRSTPDNFDRVVRYAERMGGDYAVVVIRAAVARNRDVQNTRAFIKWAAANPEAQM